ncbi:helix-turn-helix domain-containing protein [Streptomyces sp. P1-3]|uniref:helix-turn-helix domain-containing protein n=1 Tax=Streptomyces sp. P1-3 TaxID=3421658 RepID=UPI003D360FB7
MRWFRCSRGYPALTVDQVATRTGVGKAAIYRRYASKAEMAFVATSADPAMAHLLLHSDPGGAAEPR